MLNKKPLFCCDGVERDAAGGTAQAHRAEPREPNTQYRTGPVLTIIALAFPIEPHDHPSSVPPGHYSPVAWLNLIRGHWGGVEIRNHWRRDAIMGEDDSRSRQPNLLANLALLRNVLLAVRADHFPDRPLPQIQEQLHSHPGQCLALLLS